MNKLITRILCAALVVAATLTLAACAKAETPLTTAELLDLGEKYLLELNYEQALVQFLEVIEVEPRNPRGYTGAADAYIGLGDAAGAEAVLRKGLQALPGNAEIIGKAAELGIDVGAAQTAKADSGATPTPTPEPDPTPEPTPPPIVYEVGDIIQFGDYDWRVLDVQDGMVLIITDEVIGDIQYYGERVSVTWETSDMRAYLNGEFYDSFSEADRARIADTNVVNDDNPWTFYNAFAEWDGRNTPGGADTVDKIFLLSIDEVIRYFGDSGQLANRPALGYINDQYDSDRIARNANGSRVGWWLRSPGGHFPDLAVYVTNTGYVSVGGHPVDRPGGVRPALWLNLES